MHTASYDETLFTRGGPDDVCGVCVWACSVASPAHTVLDTESEALVMEALEKASQKCTSMVIAHRLKTVRDRGATANEKTSFKRRFLRFVCVLV